MIVNRQKEINFDIYEEIQYSSNNMLTS